MATGNNTTDTHVDIMEEILSGTKDEWKDFIVKEYPELHGYLKKAVTELGLVDYYKAETGRKVLPSQANQILAALNYCKPEEVKVIILGHDPACGYCKRQPLATGLAFSYPQGITEEDVNNIIREFQYKNPGSDLEPGRSVLDVHAALRQAGIEPGESCCHEHWAGRGVLLLNACLTIDPGNRTEQRKRKIENPHFKHWKNFTHRLLSLLLQKIRQEREDPSPVFLLCWGTQAKDVGRLLGSQGKIKTPWKDDHNGLLHPPPVIIIGHHPTFPKKASENNFITQATNQFKAIKVYTSYSTLFNQQEEEEDEEEDHQDDVNQLSESMASSMHIS